MTVDKAKFEDLVEAVNKARSLADLASFSMRAVQEAMTDLQNRFQVLERAENKRRTQAERDRVGA